MGITELVLDEPEVFESLSCGLTVVWADDVLFCNAMPSGSRSGDVRTVRRRSVFVTCSRVLDTTAHGLERLGLIVVVCVIVVSLLSVIDVLH